MSLNKKLLTGLLSGISIDKFPHLPCSSCGSVSLKLSSRDMRYRPLTNQYDPQQFEKEGFDSSILLGLLQVVGSVIEQLQWIQSRFSGFLKCSSCGEVVAVIGRAKVPSEYSKKNHTYFKAKLIPEFFSPPIPLIALQAEYPESVKLELAKSFATFFSDAALAGARVRVSIELLLNVLEIEKNRKDDVGNVKTTKSGREQRLTLQERIHLFKVKYPDYAKMLLAIKSIGNEASHNAEIDRYDLLDAYEILDHVLVQLFITPRKHDKILSITDNVNSKYS